MEAALNIPDPDALVQGAETALQAYAGGSAYAHDLALPSVAVWVLLIAAGLVLVEWLLARRGGRRR